MKIGFIGAGKVGQSFGLFLHNRKCSLSGYYSATWQSAVNAAQLTHSKPYASIEALVLESDIIGITVNDDQIDSVVEQIAKLKELNPSKWFFHMSGAKDIRSMAQLSEHIFALHPLKAFTDVVQSVDEMTEIYYGLETKSEPVHRWIQTLGIQTISLTSEQKSLYHLSAVLASNYLVVLIHLAIEHLKQIGISDEQAQQALMPLIRDTLTNIEMKGHLNALTGPIVRGDTETIQHHLKVLDPQAEMIYRELGKYAVSMTQHEPNLKQQLIALFEGGLS